MRSRSAGIAKVFHLAGALLGWFAVFAQLYFMLNNGLASPRDTIIHFFSYFTILTNILTAACFSMLLFGSGAGFFGRSSVLTATTVYISVVGLVFNIILRAIWSPQGLESFINELLHSVIPLLFIVYWFAFVPKNDIDWKNILPALIYPALYCVIVLMLGGSSGWYPYPFLDVVALGWQKTIVNIGGMILLFIILFILFTGIAKMMAKSK